MYYIILFVSIVIPFYFAFYYASKSREYKTRLDQVEFSYHAVNVNISEGMSYEDSMEKLMDDLSVVIYS